MLKPTEAKVIADLFYFLDKSVRNDLANKRIADERDYVSRLVTHFNYPFGILNHFAFNTFKFKSKWFARVNSGHHERKFGCDSMIVFQVGEKVKVALFEAKWPRVKIDPHYNWDYYSKRKKVSHFTDQIERQAKWTKDAAIWEMFFYEENVSVFNTPFDKNASTCIKHDYAKKYIDGPLRPTVIWDNDDLERLIISEQTPAFNGENETNLKQIVQEILTCNYGNAIDVRPRDNWFSIQSNDDQTARCPIIKFDNGEDDFQSIDGFMSENGLSFFQFLNIGRTNEESQERI